MPTIKKLGITAVKINEWLKKVELTKLIKTKGTTFKKLTPEQQSDMGNIEAALNLILSNPSMIKRPLVEKDKEIIVGFGVKDWETIFKHLIKLML